MNHFLVLVNPSAGGVETDDSSAAITMDEELQAVTAELDRHGSVTVESVDSDEDLRRVTRQTDSDTVYVVVGGDGTLHRTLNVLAERPCRYLLIPGGTGNDFAAGAGLPEDLVQAAGVARTGRARPHDLLRIHDVVAMNAAHLGIGVKAAEAAADWKDRLGKLAYPAGAVSAATSFEPTLASAVLDGDQILDCVDVALLGICNGPRVGGGTMLCPPADPSDGLLDVVVLQAQNRTDLAGITTALLRGTHLDRDDVQHHQGHELTVTIHDRDQVDWNIDGELQSLPAQIEGKVQAGAWELFTNA
ncbi:MAG: diacylglycerol/lipid kinase family protein [Euzebya sp.]